MPRDEAFDDIHIEELEELQIDGTPGPAPVAAAPPPRSRLAARAPAPKTAKDVLAAAKQAEIDAEEAAMAEKRRVAAALRAKAEEAQRRAAADAADAAAAVRQAEEDREALDAAAARARRAPRAPRELVPVGASRAARPEHTDPSGRMALEGRIGAILERFDASAEVSDLYVDVPAALVGPLWQAHRVRAVHGGDFALLVAVDAVRDLVQSRPADAVAARVTWRGGEWAVWIDLDDDRLIAALQPAELYLVGLG